MLKWMLNYTAKIQRGRREGKTDILEEEIIISYPFTCNFTVSMGLWTASNSITVQFYNLSLATQAKLWKDYGDASRFVRMEFYAGYQENMPLVFKGEFLFCHTEKQSGSTDYVTTAQAQASFDFFANTFINYTFFGGTDLKNIIATFAAESKNTYTGFISPKIGALKRPRTFIGQPMDLLKREYGGYQIFIENEELHILDENEVIPGEIQVITSDSGLLGSPKRSDEIVEITTIFEPGLKSGQAVEVLSYSEPWFNQFYKIFSITHQGTISGGVASKVTTKCTLGILGENFEMLQNTDKYSGYMGKPTEGKWAKPVQGTVSSPFGMRMHPIKNEPLFHNGMDIACQVNSDVKAPANGVVVFTGAQGGYGYMVSIDHGVIDNKRVVSFYAHLNKWLVKMGETVNAGDVIAKSGGVPGSPGAGESNGAHLHFEIRENGSPVNPTKYIGNY